MAPAATLKDVARLAGVSTATVGRVLHKNGYVAEETRTAVESAIAETGYHLNAVAQGLRKRRTFTIGHALLSVSPNPFFAGVALGIEEEAASCGCGVLTTNTQGDPARERLGVETLIRRRVDAMIFTTSADSENVRLAASTGIPVVQIERLSHVDTHAVTVDNYRGSFEATEHLIALGHRRIAYIGEAPAGPSYNRAGRRSRIVERERLSGYSDALSTHELAENPELVNLDGEYYDLHHARAVCRTLFNLPAERRPTAIFATCDMLAAGVLQEAYAHGLRVPDDLSIVGFDNTYATYLAPPLTTVEQPMVEIGRTAARMVINRFADFPAHNGSATGPHQSSDGRSETVRLAARLVIRESTGPVPDSSD
jgi:LacI family transcriptional regulator